PARGPPRGSQVCASPAWIPACHQGLSDEHHISSGPRQVDHIMRSAYAGLRDPDNAAGNERRQLAESRGLDLERLQVTRVYADDRGAGIHRPTDLIGRMNLDQWG